MATPQLSPSIDSGGVTVFAQTTPSHLLQLPTDLFLLIVDELPLHARYFLSQACRPIRRLVHQDWAKILQGNFLSHEERMEFYAGLAYLLPGKLACLRCLKLHNVDVLDTLSNGYDVRRGECPQPNANRYDRCINYSLGHNHVQLALKYARLDLDGPYADYLAQLMAPFTFDACHGAVAAIGESCTKVPSIRAGRFILQTVIKYTEAPDNPTGLSSGHLRMSMLCRHTRISALLEGIVAESYKNPADRTRALLATGNADLRFACQRCRTDILTQWRYGEWTFRSWQDFGSETEAGIGPSDILFTQFQWGWWGRRDVGHLRVPLIPHAHGSIEKLWRSEAS